MQGGEGLGLLLLNYGEGHGKGCDKALRSSGSVRPLRLSAARVGRVWERRRGIAGVHHYALMRELGGGERKGQGHRVQAAGARTWWRKGATSCRDEWLSVIGREGRRS